MSLQFKDIETDKIKYSNEDEDIIKRLQEENTALKQKLEATNQAVAELSIMIVTPQ